MARPKVVEPAMRTPKALSREAPSRPEGLQAVGNQAAKRLLDTGDGNHRRRLPRCSGTGAGCETDCLATRPALIAGVDPEASLEREAKRIARVPPVPAGAPHAAHSAASSPVSALVPTTPPRFSALTLGPGNLLPATLRDSLNGRLGVDLSAVRVHDGVAAATYAGSVRARAFAYGSHVVFARNAYRPGTPAGQRLLLHELVHVAQQARGSRCVLREDDPDNPLFRITRIILVPSEERVGFEADGTFVWRTGVPFTGAGTHPETYICSVAPKGDTYVIPDGPALAWECDIPPGLSLEGVSFLTVAVRPSSEIPPTGGVQTIPLTAGEQAVHQGMRRLMSGPNAPIKLDEKEALRLYRILTAVVRDPIFAIEGGESWVSFARFIEANRDKIKGVIESAPSGSLTRRKLQQIIEQYGEFIAAEPIDHPDRLKTLADYEREFEYDPGWQRLSKSDRKLLLEYATYNPDDLSDERIDFSRVTTDMKMGMALKLSWTSWPGEIAQAARDAFSDPAFLITLVVIMGVYAGLWLVPDPSWVTKVAAGTLTAFLLTQFAYQDVYQFAVEWMKLRDGCAGATTVAELKDAGDVFARKVGQVGFDIILLLVMWRIGKRVETKLRARALKSGLARAEGRLAKAEARPGSGFEPAPDPAHLRVIDEARATLDPAEAADSTRVLNALELRLPADAKAGLESLRARHAQGDAGTLRTLEADIANGRDPVRVLTERALSPETRASARAELINAEAEVARYRLLQENVAADPAIRQELWRQTALRLKARLVEWGLLRNPRVRQAVKARSSGELVGAIGEFIAKMELGELYSSDYYVIEGGLEIVRELPNFSSKAEAVDAGIDPGKVREVGGHIWESVGEIDVMASQKMPGGKRAPVEIEEVKTGTSDTASGARGQLTKVMDALEAIRDGNGRLQIYQKTAKTNLGRRVTDLYDLSELGEVTLATRGIPTKTGPGGFERSVLFDRPVLEAIAAELLSGGLKNPGVRTIPSPPIQRHDNSDDLVPERRGLQPSAN